MAFYPFLTCFSVCKNFQLFCETAAFLKVFDSGRKNVQEISLNGARAFAFDWKNPLNGERALDLLMRHVHFFCTKKEAATHMTAPFPDRRVKMKMRRIEKQWRPPGTRRIVPFLLVQAVAIPMQSRHQSALRGGDEYKSCGFRSWFTFPVRRTVNRRAGLWVPVWFSSLRL